MARRTTLESMNLLRFGLFFAGMTVFDYMRAPLANEEVWYWIAVSCQHEYYGQVVPASIHHEAVGELFTSA